MLFNSYNFMIFFPIVVAIYFVIPKKVRYLWLLFSSYFFYMAWNPKYAILIATSTIITYVSGILLEYLSSPYIFGILNKKNIIAKKIVVACSFTINLGILFFFKYFDFILVNFNSLLIKVGGSVIEKPFDVILPVGISFYTFQALSYTVDVYRQDIKAEKNIFQYALFVSFFPQLVAGPIERSGNLLHQLNNADKINVWNYERITGGGGINVMGILSKNGYCGSSGNNS